MGGEGKNAGMREGEGGRGEGDVWEGERGRGKWEGGEGRGRGMRMWNREGGGKTTGTNGLFAMRRNNIFPLFSPPFAFYFPTGLFLSLLSLRHLPIVYGDFLF